MATLLVLVPVTIGLFGLAAMSFAFPILAICLNLLFRTLPNRRVTIQASKFSISVLIPAHNEEKTLSATINSIKQAVSYCNQEQIGLLIYVGADGCSDNTTKVARKHGAIVVEQVYNLGKWSTLKNLLQHLNSQDENDQNNWIAIVDAGVIWPEDFISKILSQLNEANISGICPSYSNINAKLPEKISWHLESILKRLENLAGGPVSAHGATALYRSSVLKHAFTKLSSRNWFNDDVVIPLTIRSLYSDSKIVYRHDIKVIDADRPTIQQEQNKRKRLAIGNLEWISTLWLNALKQNPVVACLALRRIFRMFWAYWFLALMMAILGTGIALIFASNSYSAFYACLSLAIATISLIFIKNTKAVFNASLLSPLYIKEQFSEEAIWK